MRLRDLRGLAAACGVAALAGCVDEQPATPLAPSTTPSLTAASADATAPEETGHLVMFRSGGVPSAFGARVAALGGRVDDTYPQVGVARVSGLSDADVTALRGESYVDAVGPDQMIVPVEPNSIQPAEMSGGGAASAVDPTQAFFYPRQWHLRAIKADRAWAKRKTGRGVSVAILDTGIDPDHEDLVGRVDPSRSRSMVAGDPRYSDHLFLGAYFPTAPEWVDLQYHGTHVAATVASNAVVAAGVTSEAQLIAVKVLGLIDTGEGYAVGGYTSTVLDGIVHAVDSGADVINMSLGGGFDRELFPETLRAVEKALYYALSRGVLVVVAAGNGGDDGIGDDINGNGTFYDTYCESLQVVCVTATGPTAAASIDGPWTDVDAFTDYSNYGRWAVSVAAPGGSDAAAVWAACSTYSLFIPACQAGGFAVGITGTSMASPHTAGLAALLVQKIGKRKGLLVRLALSATTDDLGQRGRDPYYGWGRINVAKALGIR